MESKNESSTAGKIIRCKAAIGRKPGEPLSIEEIEVDPPKAGEVRIKILCTSVCHTDIAFWKFTTGPAAKFPIIYGHEAVGLVESIGEYVEEVREGDLVVPVFRANCGECGECKSTKSNTCSKSGIPQGFMPRDGTSRFRDKNGEAVYSFLFVSSFTEYTVVDIVHVVKLNHEMPVDKACLLSCGVSTGFGAAYKLAAVEEGSTVAIFGLGVVGLAVAEGARLCKASKIIGIDINEEKFELGKKFGVTDFINPGALGDKTVSQVIKEMTAGGADYCFECIGLASVIEEAFSSSREGWGKTVILGMVMPGTPLSLSGFELLRGRSVCGSLFGGLKPKTDLPLLAQKYLNKELHLDDFITHQVSFIDINKAFELLLEGKSLRCIIWMDR
ncbi:alcohol dehydrogenase-like 2 [Mangifera indica]|uniref:alcohol dehydrogenase-like 2 n=1 Tax=Mangifera indica TaxID=29780 RepID=UPI001CF9E71C|nr:alcohol dehydrogenase-like 2 [Mangifera indica]